MHTAYVTKLMQPTLHDRVAGCVGVILGRAHRQAAEEGQQAHG